MFVNRFVEKFDVVDGRQSGVSVIIVVAFGQRFVAYGVTDVYGADGINFRLAVACYFIRRGNYHIVAFNGDLGGAERTHVYNVAG